MGHNGKVYTKIIPDASGETLIPIVKSKIVPDSIVHADSRHGHDKLDTGTFRHRRIDHAQVYVDDGDRTNRINGLPRT